MQVAFWIAVACGVLGAVTGNRTAWILLASVGLCLALDRYQVPFNFVLWLLIDLVVILAILRPDLTKADCVVLALFVPAWVFYLMPPDTRFTGSFAVVVAQLLLTFPAEAMRKGVKRFYHGRDHDHFDQMVAA